ncbi:hypothetical protein ACLK1X_02485 [Escherichia coli]
MTFMLWNQQGTHRFRPLTRIFLRTRAPRFAGLLHNAMFRHHADLGYQSQYVLAGGDFVAGRAPEFVHPVQTNALLRLGSSASTVALLVKMA